MNHTAFYKTLCPDKLKVMNCVSQVVFLGTLKGVKSESGDSQREQGGWEL